jgi:DNA replication protein DnaC
MEYAERDRQRRERERTSPTTAARRVPGEPTVLRALRLGGVPEQYRTGDWARVRPSGARAVADTIAARCARGAWSELTGRGALFLGGPGTGKSTAAGLVCRAAVTAGLSVRYSYLPVLMDEMLDNRRRLEIVREQSRVGLLVHDDFGVRSLADWEIGFLDEIVETRYQTRRPMIVTGNLTADDLTVDPRIVRMVDRWRERTAADMIPFPGRSMR